MKNLNNAAFSLMEVLLASIIFIVSISGIFATLNAVRQPVADGENKLSAAVYGKQVLEALRVLVNEGGAYPYNSVCASPCANFSLTVGTHVIPNGALNALHLSWPTYLLSKNPAGLQYTVSCGDGTLICPNAARKVDLNINY